MAKEPLRETYERVVQKRDNKRQALMEAKANIVALTARQNELKEELKLLGILDFDKLEETVQEEETNIANELNRIDQDLDNLDTVVKTQPAKSTSAPGTLTDIDTLLNRGGQ